MNILKNPLGPWLYLFIHLSSCQIGAHLFKVHRLQNIGQIFGIIHFGHENVIVFLLTVILERVLRSHCRKGMGQQSPFLFSDKPLPFKTQAKKKSSFFEGRNRSCQMSGFQLLFDDFERQCISRGKAIGSHDGAGAGTDPLTRVSTYVRGTGTGYRVQVQIDRAHLGRAGRGRKPRKSTCTYTCTST